ncbi:hypothetical protein [Paenibacillus sp.]|jgi:stage V sporulation protein K|uniref:hypothetical protein n=1 Tax=Paenibacillus sp. TaxID=58172 RepID=UPI0035CD27E1
MNGRIAAANGRPKGRPSRQINVILRNHEPPVLSNAVPEKESAPVQKNVVQISL